MKKKILIKDQEKSQLIFIDHTEHTGTAKLTLTLSATIPVSIKQQEKKRKEN